MPHPLRARNLDFSALRPDKPPAVPYDPFSSPLQPQDSESGWEEFIKVPGSATNATLSFTVPGDCWLLPLSCQVQLQTDANVANRSVVIDLGDGQGTSWAKAISNQTQAASLTNNWWFAYNMTVMQTDGAGNHIAPLPHVVLNPGGKVNFRISSGQAADVLSAATIYCRKWRNRPARVSRQHPRPPL